MKRSFHGQSGQNGISREVIAEAVTQIVGCTERCRRSAQQLAKLTLIPLTTCSMLSMAFNE